MILSEIKRYFKQQKCLALQDLALHFDTHPDAMRGMLEHWIRKGKLRKEVVRQGCTCSGCSKCDSASLEMYEWVS